MNDSTDLGSAGWSWSADALAELRVIIDAMLADHTLFPVEVTA